MELLSLYYICHITPRLVHYCRLYKTRATSRLLCPPQLWRNICCVWNESPTYWDLHAVLLVPTSMLQDHYFWFSCKITLDNMQKSRIIEVWFSSVLNRLEITAKFNNFHVVDFSKKYCFNRNKHKSINGEFFF